MNQMESTPIIFGFTLMGPYQLVGPGLIIMETSLAEDTPSHYFSVENLLDKCPSYSEFEAQLRGETK